MIPLSAYFVLFTFVALLLRTFSIRNRHHLTDYVVNTKGLSVMGFAFNHHRNPPDWVDHLLGEKAVFWGRYPSNENVSDVSMIVFARNNYLSTSHLKFKAAGEWPECSVEMIGFVRTGRKKPYSDSRDKSFLPVGTAQLKVLNGTGKGITLHCYHREVYENSRFSGFDSLFWASMIYCPITTSRRQCKRFRQQYEHGEKLIQYYLEFDDHPQNWNAKFTTYYERKSEVTSQKPADVAVCTAWTYETDHPEKLAVNRAIIYEFIRYYSNLGIKVIAYDRNGANLRGAFESDYVKANPQHSAYADAIDHHFVYNNWSIHSLLMQDDSVFFSDMEGHSHADRDPIKVDKALCYTLCRFEAKAKYGITKAMAIDFDEFLYCKHAKDTVAAQSHYIHQYLGQLQEAGYDQVMFGKTTLAKRRHDITMEQCVIDEVNNSDEGGSVLNCISSIDYIQFIDYHKSIHIGNSCPMTSRHHACAACDTAHVGQCTTEHQLYHQVDCVCNSVELFACDFVHFTLVEENFEWGTVHSGADSENAPSELISIVSAG